VETVELSRDHNARMPEEQAALRAAHPNESNIVTCKTPEACYVKGRSGPLCSRDARCRHCRVC
jgi:hypothetical protein